VFVPAKNHLLTSGLSFYRDRSSDQRTTTTQMSLLGQVALGARGPAPVVFPSPVALGPPSIAHPVRVPDASLRDVAVFAQDEWRVKPTLSVVAGLRGDFYTVITEATPGYDVQAVIGNATPAIDQSKLPDPNGATYSRKAMTGDIGVVANPDGAVNPFVRFGRSFRHPNLEEMLFAGHGDERQPAAERDGRARDRQQLRRRREVPFRIVQRRRLLFLQPVPELHRAGPGGREQRVRPARAGAQLRQRSHHRR
jgi:hemoglobin/transferrin/lactoferrin receptor protein